MIKKLLFALITIILSTNYVTAKDLDLSQFELKACYNLTSDGTDSTGNYDPINLAVPIFEDGGIFSRGCWNGSPKPGDSCLIATPQIDAMDDIAFAIQIDFKLSTYGMPIYQAGTGWRYLGLQTSMTGSPILKTGSQAEEEITGHVLNVDEWYTSTVVHNTHDSVTNVYINNELIFTKKKYLEHPSNDNIISNTDYSRGRAYFGYIRNLRVFSTNSILSVDDPFNKHQELRIFPNPANLFVSIEGNLPLNSEYFISNSLGKIVLSGKANTNTIDVKSLPVGIYYLRINNKGYKFIKN